MIQLNMEQIDNGVNAREITDLAFIRTGYMAGLINGNYTIIQVIT